MTARGGDAAHHLGDPGEGPGLVAGIDALRREPQEELLAHSEPAAAHARQQHLVGGAGIGGGLQHHQRTGPQRVSHAVRRRHDEGNVGLLGLPERSGHADHDGVGLAQRVGRGVDREAPARHQRGQQGGGHVLHRAHAAREERGADGVGVHPDHPKAGPGEGHREGQPDVPQAHHAHRGGAARQALLEPGPERAERRHLTSPGRAPA